jgi:hypothetical protein
VRLQISCRSDERRKDDDRKRRQRFVNLKFRCGSVTRAASLGLDAKPPASTSERVKLDHIHDRRRQSCSEVAARRRKMSAADDDCSEKF